MYERITSSLAAALLVLGVTSGPSGAQEVNIDAARLNRLAAELSAGEWRGHNRADLGARLIIETTDKPYAARLHIWGGRDHPLNAQMFLLNPSATGERLHSADTTLHSITLERQFDDCVRLAGEVRPDESRPHRVAVDEIFCPERPLGGRLRSRWVGRWETPLGILEIQEGRGGVLRGWFSRPDAQGNSARYRRVAFGAEAQATLLGGWSGMASEAGNGVQLRYNPDGTFAGRIWLGDDTPRTFTGRRIESSPPAPPPTSSSSPPSSPAPGSGQPTPMPDTAGGFSRLGAFEVRFDRLERVQGSHVIRAVVTIRNAGQQLEHLPSGTFRAILTDAEGAGQERNQLWRGSGEPAQLFNGTPALQPGGELTVRFTFNPDIPRLDRLVLMRGSEQVEFDLAGR